jgi:hypothetical protein
MTTDTQRGADGGAGLLAAIQAAGPFPLIHEVGGYFWCCHCHAGSKTKYLIDHAFACSGVRIAEALTTLARDETAVGG